MKKLIALFLVIGTMAFAQTMAPLVDWSKYWTSQLRWAVLNSIKDFNKDYDVVFNATDKELHIVILTGKPPLKLPDFTKYDNISLSAAVLRQLGRIGSFKGLVTIYIDTFPYTRKVIVKDLIANKKNPSDFVFIENMELTNATQQEQSQTKK